MPDEPSNSDKARIVALLKRWRMPNCRDGDEGVRMLLNRYHRLLLSLLDNDEALLQDCVIRILAKIHTLQDVSRFTSWICRIAVCLKIDAIRAHRRTRRENRNEFFWSAFASQCDGPLEQVIRADRIRVLQLAMTRMCERDRKLIELRFFSRLRYWRHRHHAGPERGDC